MNKNKIDKDYGMFIGMSSLPIYSSKGITLEDFEHEVLNETFTKFRKKLTENIVNAEGLGKVLYKPVHFYALGSFSFISLSFIDDFHFGNFSFKPYNKFISEKYQEDSNFQYQVINSYKLDYRREITLDEISKSPFISICKLKINSSILLGLGCDIIKQVKEQIKAKYTNKHTKLIITESFSWHELTIIFMCKKLSNITHIINELRHQTTSSFKINIDNSLAQTYKESGQEVNVFTDSGTTYGINPSFFVKDSNSLKEYLNYGDKETLLKISSKISIKTGHAGQLLSLLSEPKFNDIVDVTNFNIVNGRSDYSLKFINGSFQNYLKFWVVLHQNRSMYDRFYQHVRKFHSNLSIVYDKKNYVDLDTNLHKKLFETLRFSSSELRRIESSLQALKVSKDIANTVASVYTTFNDIICDINLYSFYIDLKSILTQLFDLISALTIEDNTKYSQKMTFGYRKVFEVSNLLLSFVGEFNTAYNNRFLDSKRNGYNLDTKGEFNGGVHQILFAYDSLFKIMCNSLRLTKDSLSLNILPIVSFGNYTSGIKSNIVNLHLNYFQLFQPEFFLFSLPKESINHLINKSILKKANGINIDNLLLINNLKDSLATKINNEPDVNKKALLFKYLPLTKLKLKIDYILYYLVFIKLQWFDDIETFSFWLWNSYVQNSTLYNIDGSLRVDLLREHFFAYYMAVKHLHPSDSNRFDFERLRILVNSPEIIYHLFESKDCIISEVVLVEKILSEYDQDNQQGDLELLMELMSNSEELTAKLMKSISEGESDLTSKYCLETFDLIRKYLTNLKELVVSKEKESNNELSCYIRDPQTGKGINSSKYSKVLFDPHGGIFVRDPNLRISFFKQRIKIMNKARDIGYRFKKDII